MNKEKVLGLAKLARIEIGDEEAEILSHEFDAILGYVGEVKSVSGGSKDISKEEYVTRNTLRDDNKPHESGMFTQQILEQAPSRDKDYIKVKKIL